MTVAEIVLTVAVILGPLLAVVVTRYMESCRIQREQRMYVFRTLMRTEAQALGGCGRSQILIRDIPGLSGIHPGMRLARAQQLTGIGRQHCGYHAAATKTHRS